MRLAPILCAAKDATRAVFYSLTWVSSFTGCWKAGPPSRVVHGRELRPR